MQVQTNSLVLVWFGACDMSYGALAWDGHQVPARQPNEVWEYSPLSHDTEYLS